MATPSSSLVDASCGPFSPLCVSASERANDKAQKTKLRAAYEQTENGKKLLQNSNNVKSARRHKHRHTRTHTQRERLALALKLSQRHLQSSSSSQAEAATVAEAAQSWIRLNMRGPFVCSVCVCVSKLAAAASASVCQRRELLSAVLPLPLPQSLPVIRICFRARFKRRLWMPERAREREREKGPLWGSGDRCMLH